MDRQNRWIFLMVGLIIVLLALRFLVMFRFVLISVLVVGGLAVGATWLIQYFRDRKQEKQYQGTIEGRVASRLEQCKLLLEKNEGQLEEITKAIQNIEHKRREVGQLSTANQQESARLLAGFKREKKLRQTKQEFYSTCIEKLDNLLHNHQMAQALSEEKQKLLDLQENKYEELAEMEEIRYDLETDVFYLDAIDELSEKMLVSDSVETASGLQLELEKMTEKLKRL